MSVLGVTRTHGSTAVSWNGVRVPAASRRGCLFAHGATGTAASYLNVNNKEQPERLAQRMYIGYADDFTGAPGGTDAWGNDGVADASTGSGKSALDALEALGAVGPHDGVGFSMGALNLLNIAKRAPSRFRRLVLICPVIDLADVHDNNRGALAASIETAYGGSGGYSSAVAAHNPNDSAFRSAIITAGWRVRIYYSDDDPICIPSVVTAFGTAINADSVISLGSVGHSTAPTKAEEIADWLWAA